VPADRLLIADPDPAMRRDLARALAREGFTPLLAGDGPTVLRLAGRSEILAMVIADDIPGLDGVSACRRLREAGNGVPVVLVARADDPRARAAGLDAGADDYLVLPLLLPELVARLRGLVRRAHPSSAPAALSCGDIVLDPAARRATRAGQALELTATEFRLLELFMRNPERVLASSVIHRHLWGSAPAGTSDPLPVHLGGLRRKLEALGRPRVIHHVRGTGHVLMAGSHSGNAQGTSSRRSGPAPRLEA